MNFRTTVLSLSLVSSIFISISPALADGAAVRKHMSYRTCHAKAMTQLKNINNRKDRAAAAKAKCLAETGQTEKEEVNVSKDTSAIKVTHTRCVTQSGKDQKPVCTTW